MSYPTTRRARLVGTAAVMTTAATVLVGGAGSAGATGESSTTLQGALVVIPGEHTNPTGVDAPDHMLLKVNNKFIELEGSELAAAVGMAPGQDVSVTVVGKDVTSGVDKAIVALTENKARVVAMRATKPRVAVAQLTPQEASTEHTFTIVSFEGKTISADVLRKNVTDSANFWVETLGNDMFSVKSISVKASLPKKPSMNCDNPWEMATDALAAYPEIGSLSTNNHLLTVFNGGSCGWAGLANVDGGAIWLNKLEGANPLEESITAHEIGHNLGLGHAFGVICKSAVNGKRYGLSGGSCVKQEYNAEDAMGYGHIGQRTYTLNMGTLARMGVKVITSTTVGSPVSLSPVTNTSGTRALTVGALDPVSKERVTYYIEYHPAVGRDAPSEGAGVRVTAHYEDQFPSSFGLFFPEAANQWRSMQTVPVGTEIQLPGSGYTLVVSSAPRVGASATVQLNRTGTPDAPARASISTLSMDWTSASSAKVTFALDKPLRAGDVVEYSLNGGAYRAASPGMTLGGLVAAKAHSLTLRVRGADGVSTKAVALASITPGAVGVTSPRSGASTTRAVTLSWSQGVGAPVSAYYIYVDGKRVTAASSKARSIRISVARGTHTLQVVAIGSSYGVRTASAMSSIKVI